MYTFKVILKTLAEYKEVGEGRVCGEGGEGPLSPGLHLCT